MNIPTSLQDAKDLLTKDGFTAGTIWYHGTSSALLDSIKEQGLKRSGDKAIKQTTKNIMATIGNSYTETTEPVFLTQSKELAYFWAESKVKEISTHSGEMSEPVVIEVALSDELNQKVKTDVGAASLFMVQGSSYLDHLAEIYLANDLELELIDPTNADRMDYLNKLGMAYIDQDIDRQYLEMLSC